MRHLNELEDQTLVNLVRDTINKCNGKFIIYFNTQFKYINSIVDGQEVAIEITKSQLNAISKFVEQILIKKIESALTIESSNDFNQQLSEYQ